MGEPALPAEEYAGPARVSTVGPSDGVVSTDRSQARCSTTSEGGSQARCSTTSGDRSTTTLEVEVDLRGHFEPLDGRFHWYGRIRASDALSERARSGETVVLTTPHGSAEGRLSDVDPWGRFRVAGTGRPPF